MKCHATPQAAEFLRNESATGFSLLGSPAPIHAGDRDDKCERRIHKSEENLRRAEQRHGERSRQAEQRRHQLEEAKDKCGQDRR